MHESTLKYKQKIKPSIVVTVRKNLKSLGVATEYVRAKEEEDSEALK